MKAEHRKELQTNALADHLGRFIQNLKSKPSAATVYVAGGVVLVVVIILGVLSLLQYLVSF